MSTEAFPGKTSPQAEHIYSDEFTVPVSEIERESLLFLISHSREVLINCYEGYDPAQPNFDLYAMIDTGNRYRTKMSRETVRHLKKMEVLQARLYGDVQEGGLLDNILKTAMPREIAEFESFAPDLSNISMPWELAHQDVIKLATDKTLILE